MVCWTYAYFEANMVEVPGKVTSILVIHFEQDLYFSDRIYNNKRKRLMGFTVFLFETKSRIILKYFHDNSFTCRLGCQSHIYVRKWGYHRIWICETFLQNSHTHTHIHNTVMRINNLVLIFIRYLVIPEVIEDFKIIICFSL